MTRIVCVRVAVWDMLRFICAFVCGLNQNWRWYQHTTSNLVTYYRNPLDWLYSLGSFQFYRNIFRLQRILYRKYVIKISFCVFEILTLRKCKPFTNEASWTIMRRSYNIIFCQKKCYSTQQRNISKHYNHATKNIPHMQSRTFSISHTIRSVFLMSVK